MTDSRSPGGVPKPPQGPATGADRPRVEPQPGPHSPPPPTDDKSRKA